MPIYWTIQARRHLRQALAEAIGREAGGDSASAVVGETLTLLNALLSDAFKGAEGVVVKDQVIGYRRREHQFTLMVEAFGAEDAPGIGPFVVKIGHEAKIRKEIRGWKQCRPPGMRHDLVFLSLEDKPPQKMGRHKWMCIVYGDAQQFLGVTVTVSFEEAALESIRSGFPRFLSILFVIQELFERIGHLFYSTASTHDPASGDYVLDVPHLDKSLERWRTNPTCQEAQRDANSLSSHGAEAFLDPVEYLRYVQSFVPHVVEVGKKTVIRRPSVPAILVAGMRRPMVTDLVPRMLRGHAHGDLHGRNILVGIVRDQAMWPTVFDYEDMGPRNLVGWDFVKLETELKIRAYVRIFAGKEAIPFAGEVQKLELELNKRTEDCHHGQDWPEGGDPKSDRERLILILMTIRKLAGQHLGINHGRPNDWLEEYYFLLACYGVATGRFDNLQHLERLGALVSAGVAASRLSWVRTIEKDNIVLA